MPRLVLASKNKGKLRELETMLAGSSWELCSVADFPELPPVVENGQTFRENAVKKALTVANILKEWTLADDSGLEVDALGGAPGVYSARFAGEPGDDRKNNEKLLRLLAGVPVEQRTARFRCVLALASPGGEIWTTERTCEGLIGLAPRGNRGFGYDPLFYLPELGVTMAELPEEKKNEISHRGKAMRDLLAHLQAIVPDRID
ncbi:MAG: XTP/dITP diphosphatase [Clostridia bacterium]|nr:XTP/dITP diphosphatase [Clostridia bacterium]